MSPFFERSAGVIPFRIAEDGTPRYLVLHSATVRNPRARWEFPKGGMDPGETTTQTAAREFQEETSLTDWSFRQGFERSLSYTYLRQGRKVLKTVVYYMVEVHDASTLACSAEHTADPFGHWHHWGTFEEISRYLYHAKIRQLFADAHEWLTGEPVRGPGR
ncbi:bis(5'-nucleosyl)-tetraphosphatase [Tautonia marina]|uniref:bis(5'-nucleosyl)-tetraphosphatase n=1 Tax=Tautonia marina TaxID=2653855 RepID=UPI001260A9DD|nr:NUDIX domain-containing protein [Tautonia marina]